MARITQEDCLRHVDNRFDLVLQAAQRAHQLERDQSDPQIEHNKDKPTVIALREIANGIDVTAIESHSAEEQLAAIDKQLQAELADNEGTVDAELMAAFEQTDDTSTEDNHDALSQQLAAAFAAAEGDSKEDTAPAEDQNEEA